MEIERYVTAERFSLYRLCECETCEGSGKTIGKPEYVAPGLTKAKVEKCPECRGEGRVRQELAARDSPEAVGVALVTLGREGEWEGCAFGLLDRRPECERCGHPGYAPEDCPQCHGSRIKPTGTWLLLPWMPSARNVRDAARTLARSKKTSREA